MLFHTWLFGCFFAVTCFGYFLLGKWFRQRTLVWVTWLLVASYVFYAAWNPIYLLLILYSTALDFWVVARMDHSRSERARSLWLWVSLVNNLGILAFFKYANFFVDNVNSGLAWIGFTASVPSVASWMPFGWEYVLPVGISFFTFQSMSYTIDFYRGNIAREPSFLRFAAFVSFFPQLVAGPIERSSNLLPQLTQFPDWRWENVAEGGSLFLTGLFKKLALANYLAGYVERVYQAPGEFGAPALMLATFCFAWQIYFDFSGYTDMARGVAWIMGFRLMRNFDHPYLAAGVGEFWSRWHISLSTWFRDYVYIPLGGNRGGEARTARNLLLVFVISGFWHGAAWTFLIWGALHAVGALATRRLERASLYQRVPLLLKQVGVFAFVCFAWVFFRAESVADAVTILQRIVSGPWEDPQCPVWMLCLVALVWAFEWVSESRFAAVLDQAWLRVGLAISMVVYLALAASGGGEFIYFQF